MRFVIEQLSLSPVMATHHDLRDVIHDYAFTNLGILGLQCYAGITRHAMSALWMAGMYLFYRGALRLKDR